MGQEAITKEEAVRLALAEVGDVSSADLAAFIERQYRLRIDPRFMPIFRATVRDKERLQQARAAPVSLPPEGPTPET
jgi:hypothetical protein